jgi:dynein heavy chain
LDGFEKMQATLLREPDSTCELMELVEYIDHARGMELALLKEDIIEAVKQHFALLDVHIFGIADMRNALTVQTWHRKIQPVFEKSAIVSCIIFWVRTRHQD